jgi:two-component system CheB/CheR fusion protein
MMAEPNREFEELLEYLKRTRGFDFTGYKHSSLQRRIGKRMQALGIDSYSVYTDHLEVHPEEFATLFDTVLINVTGFFRDPEAWEMLGRDIIPDLLARRAPDAPIRAWSAGCSSGEEAYSVAMLLAEELGMQQFQERVKIYATDVDEHALAKARQALYTPRESEGVPPALRERYFERQGDDYCFRKELRRQVIFGRHDLMQDAPISRVDLLVCRNTLMYFNAESQGRILARFHFALNDGGILFLGRAETLLSRSDLFTPVDLKRRISMKVPRSGLRDHLLLMAQPAVVDPAPRLGGQQRAREAAFEASPLAQLVVDEEGTLVLANERARALFGIGADDVGRPIQDLTVSYKPLELRSRIEQARAERRVVAARAVEWAAAGEPHWFDVQIQPLVGEGGRAVGAAINFVDVTMPRRLQRELEDANQELEAAYEELQSTNEELETTNEELQSTVEELETTNEELQSTNEELETMNEELHSTNEELQTINDELRMRSDELHQVNELLAAILQSMQGGVVVLSRELEVLLWNDQAEELWGLRREEVVGRHFLNLDIGLPVDQLQQPLRSALGAGGGASDVTLEAVDRRGHAVQCRVRVTPLRSSGRESRGAIILMEAQPDRDRGAAGMAMAPR